MFYSATITLVPPVTLVLHGLIPLHSLYNIHVLLHNIYDSTKYIDKYYTHHPNVPKFCILMNMTSKSKNVKLAKFISCILELF